MIRGNLGMAMQGLAVVPLFAGYDVETARRAGSSPTTSPAAATRSTRSTRSAPARCSPAAAEEALPRRPRRGRRRAPRCVQALYDAADDDSATGGPDLARRHLPGRRRGHRRRLPPAARRRGRRAVVEPWSPTAATPAAPTGPLTPRLHSPQPDREDGPPVSMPFYVSPEQVMKDRADYARKGIARGRSVVVLQYADGIAVRRREPLPRAAQGQRDLRPDRVRRGRQVQRVREPARRRRPARRPARLLLRPPTT